MPSRREKAIRILRYQGLDEIADELQFGPFVRRGSILTLQIDCLQGSRWLFLNKPRVTIAQRLPLPTHDVRLQVAMTEAVEAAAKQKRELG